MCSRKFPIFVNLTTNHELAALRMLFASSTPQFFLALGTRISSLGFPTRRNDLQSLDGYPWDVGTSFALGFYL
jgi:hypothetical protein